MKLSDYQTAGVDFLASRRFALLADDPGLGKTAQTITASDAIEAKRVLVICPAVARVNWQREFSMWSFLNYPQVLTKLSQSVCNESLVVSYDYAVENSQELKRIPWDLVVIDESHFIKEPTSKRTKAILGVEGIIQSAKRLWLLCGTPAPNHAGELWPILYTFGATTLSYDKFIETFCNTRATYYGGKYKRKVTGTKKSAIAKLRELLSPIMLRRLKKDVLKELPPKIYEVVAIEGEDLIEIAKKYLPEDQRKELVQKARNEEDYLASRIDEIDALLESLGNSVSTLRRLVALQKIKSVADLVAMELEAGHYKKIIVFGYHTDAIDGLEKLLNEKKIKTAKITGKTTNKQPQVDLFQNDPEVKVFLGNFIAAGTAITLTASSEVLFFEESWVPGENVQASDRAHRRGQQNVVRVRFACLANSIDEKVQNTNRRKAEELSELFD